MRSARPPTSFATAASRALRRRAAPLLRRGSLWSGAITGRSSAALAEPRGVRTVLLLVPSANAPSLSSEPTLSDGIRGAGRLVGVSWRLGAAIVGGVCTAARAANRNWPQRISSSLASASRARALCLLCPTSLFVPEPFVGVGWRLDAPIVGGRCTAVRAASGNWLWRISPPQTPGWRARAFCLPCPSSLCVPRPLVGFGWRLGAPIVGGL